MLLRSLSNMSSRICPGNTHAENKAEFEASMKQLAREKSRSKKTEKQLRVSSDRRIKRLFDKHDRLRAHLEANWLQTERYSFELWYQTTLSDIGTGFAMDARSKEKRARSTLNEIEKFNYDEYQHAAKREKKEIKMILMESSKKALKDAEILLG